MSEDIQPVQDVQEAQNETAAPAPNTLHHNDIINAERIIAAAMERNTFKARELVEVAAVYARLVAFIDTIPPEQRGSHE